MKKYYIQELIEEKRLDTSKLDDELKETVDLLKETSGNFTIDDEVARETDDLLKELIPPSAIKKAKAPAKKAPAKKAPAKKAPAKKAPAKKAPAKKAPKIKTAKKATKAEMEEAFGKDFMESKDKGRLKEYPEKKKPTDFKKATDKLDECRELIKADNAKKKASEPEKPKPQAKTVFRTAGSSYSQRIFKIVKKRDEDDLSLATKVKDLMIKNELNIHELVFGSTSASDKKAITSMVEERFNSAFKSAIEKSKKKADGGLFLDDVYYEDGGEIGDYTEYGDVPGAYARKDSKTGKGMNEGFVFEDGDKYFENESDALEYAKSKGYKNLKESYDDEHHYWTTWWETTIADDGGYYTEDSEFIKVMQNGGLPDLTVYEVIISPSSDTETIVEEADDFYHAKEMVYENPELGSYHAFKSKGEMEAFLDGYRNAIGYLGDGVYWINPQSGSDYKLGGEISEFDLSEEDIKELHGFQMVDIPGHWAFYYDPESGFPYSAVYDGKYVHQFLTLDDMLHRKNEADYLEYDPDLSAERGEETFVDRYGDIQTFEDGGKFRSIAKKARRKAGVAIAKANRSFKESVHKGKKDTAIDVLNSVSTDMYKQGKTSEADAIDDALNLVVKHYDCGGPVK